MLMTRSCAGVIGALAVWIALLSLAPPITPAWPQASARPIVERPDLARFFKDAGTEGTIVVLDAKASRFTVHDRRRAETGLPPHSTFKIANSLIALETGVALDADQPTFPWDGVARKIADWDRDHTLRTAFKASVVPVYQEIARRIGAERMKQHVAALDYGNRDIGGA